LTLTVRPELVEGQALSIDSVYAVRPGVLQSSTSLSWAKSKGSWFEDFRSCFDMLSTNGGKAISDALR